jgi:lysophospholipase L1-like esterase
MSPIKLKRFLWKANDIFKINISLTEPIKKTRDGRMKINLVNTVATLSIIASLTWLIGLGMAIDDQLLKDTSSPLPSTTTDDAEPGQLSGRFVLALGDSLTRGTGDTSGQGYVTYMMDELNSKDDESINLSNLAVGGYTSKELLNQVQQTEIQRQIAQAETILMTIGGNDLFRGGQALFEFSTADIEESKQSYMENLESIYTSIRDVNPEATVYHIGLYNPFSELDNGNDTSSMVREWNFDSAKMAANFNSIVYVPSYDLFQLNVENYLYSDQFHPNNKGYELIGDRLISLITLEKGEEINE